MKKQPIVILSLLALGACAYGIEGQIQDISFETPGARGAVCDVWIDNVRYIVNPPQSLKVMRSRKDMTVDCKAPGNRRKKIFIEPEYEGSAKWNALNAGAGLPWDYASGSVFHYPDYVEVNFTDTPVTDQPLPAQNQPDIRAPETYPLEEFLPGRPRMNSDSDAYQMPLRKRGEDADPWATDSSASTVDETSGFTEPAQPASDKGDLQNVINRLGAEPASAAQPAKTQSAKSSGSSAPAPSAQQMGPFKPAGQAAEKAGPLPLLPGE